MKVCLCEQRENASTRSSIDISFNRPTNQPSRPTALRIFVSAFEHERDEKAKQTNGVSVVKEEKKDDDNDEEEEEEAGCNDARVLQ